MNRIPYKWLVAIAFVAGFFMDLMDTTIVNVAIPALAKELRAPDTTLEWVVTGYLLSLGYAASLPMPNCSFSSASCRASAEA